MERANSVRYWRLVCKGLGNGNRQSSGKAPKNAQSPSRPVNAVLGAVRNKRIIQYYSSSDFANCRTRLTKDALLSV
jgi:hypothetical protein